MVDVHTYVQQETVSYCEHAVCECELACPLRHDFLAEMELLFFHFQSFGQKYLIIQTQKLSTSPPSTPHSDDV